MPAGDSQTVHPSVTWAQRKELVYINIDVPDVKNPEIKVEKDSLYFKGKSAADDKTYEASLGLFGEVNKDESKFAVRGRNIEFVLIKESKDGEYWPRLLKENKKYHWLKIDFGKWKDEDDSDNEGGEAGGPGGPGGAGGADFEDMMRQMGGLGGMGGMGGMPGMGGMGGMGMPGMGGMGMPGMGGMPDFGDLDGDEGGDSDDDDLPDLEDTKGDSKTPAASSDAAAAAGETKA